MLVSPMILLGLLAGASNPRPKPGCALPLKAVIPYQKEKR